MALHLNIFIDCYIVSLQNIIVFNQDRDKFYSCQRHMCSFFLENDIYTHNLCLWELVKVWHSAGGPQFFITMINEILSSACVDLWSASCFSVIHLYIKNPQLYYKTSAQEKKPCITALRIFFFRLLLHASILTAQVSTLMKFILANSIRCSASFPFSFMLLLKNWNKFPLFSFL